MTLYEKYIKGLIEVEDLPQKEFNEIVLCKFNDYKKNNGTYNFKEFLELIEITGL